MPPHCTPVQGSPAASFSPPAAEQITARLPVLSAHWIGLLHRIGAVGRWLLWVKFRLTSRHLSTFNRCPHSLDSGHEIKQAAQWRLVPETDSLEKLDTGPNAKLQAHLGLGDVVANEPGHVTWMRGHHEVASA